MADTPNIVEAVHDFAAENSNEITEFLTEQLPSDYYRVGKAGDISLLIHPNELYVQSPGEVSPSPIPFSRDDSPELIIRTAAMLPGSQLNDLTVTGPMTDGYEELNEFTQLVKTERPNKFYMMISLPVFTLYNALPYPERIDWIHDFFTAIDAAIERIRSGEACTASILDNLSDADLERRGIRRWFTMSTNTIEQLESELSSQEAHLRSAQDTALQYAQRVNAKRQEIAAFDPDAGKIDLTTIHHPDIISVTSKKDANERWYVELITVPLFMRPDRNPENLPIPDEGIPIGQICAKLYFGGDASNPFRIYQHGTPTIGQERRSVPHPHIMSGHQPCLGSFGDTVIDAVTRGDIHTLIDIMILFLQQANTGDSAGRTWPYWLDRRYKQVGSNETQPEQTEGEAA